MVHLVDTTVVRSDYSTVLYSGVGGQLEHRVVSENNVYPISESLFFLV
jgi:hypothetical protein